MSKKIATFLVLGLFILVFSAQAQQYEVELSPEEHMYILDQGDHFPKEFRPVLRDVNRNHYNYSRDEVATMVISSYEVIQKENPDVSIYDTLKDIERYSEDELGIDLSTYIVAYIRSQVK